MRTSKSKTLVGIVLVTLLALSVGTVSAASWDPDKDVGITITVNGKLDLTIEEGGSITQVLDPGETVELAGKTKVNVKTNIKNWKITAQVTGDENGFLNETGAKLEIKSYKDLVSTALGWVSIDTDAAQDVTPVFENSQGAQNLVEFGYQVTTTWTHEPDGEYPMIITYTAMGA
jgi:hypothetical protein